ncbi:YciI family protein [Guptibacillus hwajinpoensis]|uniref:YciI family protein n=1 Tax=Guptibacillus hwajinpoensis TaxID=208199 RepID=UPI00384D65C0
MKQFLYKLTLIPELLEESNWTDKENNSVSEHFHALQLLLKNNTLIMAGRTLNNDPSSFGIVVIQVSSEKEAEALMKSDPAVRDGIMTAELFPYSVALYNEDFTTKQTSS